MVIPLAEVVVSKKQKIEVQNCEGGTTYVAAQPGLLEGGTECPPSPHLRRGREEVGVCQSWQKGA